VPPTAASRIPLPPEFGRRFAIFADAEEEFDWNAPFARDATATTAIAALPEATSRFVAAGCVPTHMVDWPVVANEQSAAIMAELAATDACEIGAQLHPWVNPPFDEVLSAKHSYLGNLARDMQHSKLHALTDKITAATGVRPASYRAGRYGVGVHTAYLLAEAGYRLDVSVRSLFDYTAQSGPNFSNHPVWPYRVVSGLNELPLTAAFTGALRHYPKLHGTVGLQGVLARGKLLDRVPLTPEGVPLAQALAAIRQLLDDGHQLFSLSFHTPSLVPGHTPYVRNSQDLKTFWAWWDGVFDLFAREGVTGIRASEIMAVLEANS
jgi:hypothetical protein